jgi:hypothetical protein
VINIVNSNQGKVQIRKKNKLETDIDPASCEQLQAVFLLCWHSFVPALCERGLNYSVNEELQLVLPENTTRNFDVLSEG